MKDLEYKMDRIQEKVDRIGGKVNYETSDIKKKLKSMVKKTNVILTATGHAGASPSVSQGRSPTGGSNRGGFLGDEDGFIQGPRIYHVQNQYSQSNTASHNFYPEHYGSGSQSLGIS